MDRNVSLTPEQAQMRDEFARIPWHRLTPADLGDLSDALVELQANNLTRLGAPEDGVDFDIEKWEVVPA